MRALTRLPTLPGLPAASGSGAAPGAHPVDAPSDYRPHTRSRRGGTHRFPAALALLFAAILFLLATGRGDTRSGVVALVCLGALTVAALVALVAVLRSQEREHDILAERVRMYDARLLELRPRR